MTHFLERKKTWENTLNYRNQDSVLNPQSKAQMQIPPNTIFIINKNIYARENSTYSIFIPYKKKKRAWAGAPPLPTCCPRPRSDVTWPRHGIRGFGLDHWIANLSTGPFLISYTKSRLQRALICARWPFARCHLWQRSNLEFVMLLISRNWEA